MSSTNNVSIAYEPPNLPAGAQTQGSAASMTNSQRAKNQNANNKSFQNGGKPPANYGISPDSAASGYSTVPTFLNAGAGSQNGNASSVSGNTNYATGTAQSVYDICASNPSAAGCSATAQTINAPVASGGGKKKKKTKRKYKKKTKKTKRKVKKSKKKRSLKKKSYRRRVKK